MSAPNAPVVSKNPTAAQGLATNISGCGDATRCISGSTPCSSATISARHRQNCPSSGIKKALHLKGGGLGGGLLSFGKQGVRRRDRCGPPPWPSPFQVEGI